MRYETIRNMKNQSMLSYLLAPLPTLDERLQKARREIGEMSDPEYFNREFKKAWPESWLLIENIPVGMRPEVKAWVYGFPALPKLNFASSQ